MKINKVASSSAELNLFNLLNREKKITKVAILGAVRPLLGILGKATKYGAVGFGSLYAIDTASEYLSGDLSEQDLDDILLSDNSIQKEYTLLKEFAKSTNIEEICALWLILKEGPSSKKDATTPEEKSSGDSFEKERESIRDFLKGADYRQNNIEKISQETCDIQVLISTIEKTNLDNLIIKFKTDSKLLDEAISQANSASGLFSGATGVLKSTFESAKNMAEGFGLPQGIAPDLESQDESIQKANENLKKASKRYAESYTNMIEGLSLCIRESKKIINHYSSKKLAIESLGENNSALDSQIDKTRGLLEACYRFIGAVDSKLQSLHKRSKKAREIAALKSKFNKNYLIPKNKNFEDKRFNPRYEKMTFENLYLSAFYKKPFQILRIDSLNIRLPEIRSGGGYLDAYDEKIKEHVQRLIKNELLNVQSLSFLGRSKLGNTSRNQDLFWEYLSTNGYIDELQESFRRLVYKVENSSDSKFNKVKTNIRDAKEKYRIPYGSTDFMTTAHNYKYYLALLTDFIMIANDIGSEGAKEKARNSFSLALEEFISDEYLPENKKSMEKKKNVYKKYKKYDNTGRSVRDKYRKYDNLTYDMEVSSKNQQNNLEKHSHSINKNESIVKNSNFLDQYYKDAISGLSNPDPLLKEFYQSMRQETLRNSELRDARKNLRGSEEQEGQDIVNQAHPKEIRLSDAHGDGGLLENGNEQKERSLQVAKKNPTGNFK